MHPGADARPLRDPAEFEFQCLGIVRGREGILDRANMDFLSRELGETCAVVETEWLRPKG